MVPRNELLKVKKDEIPFSTEKIIIVKSTEDAIGYNQHCYNEKFLSNRVDEARFNETVKKASRICENEYVRSKFHYILFYYLSSLKFSKDFYICS